MKKNQIILFFFYILAANLASCQNESVKPEAWLRYPKSKVPQILLTNRSSFNKYGSSGGASGFLVEYNGKILAITAKHLTQEAGGFDPPIPTDSINITKNQWVMHPRTLKNDSVVLGRLLNDKPDSTDALAFEVDKPNPKIYPL